ncbi:MAG: DUF6807 family protein [Planctomycetaceae bacterium]
MFVLRCLTAGVAVFLVTCSKPTAAESPLTATLTSDGSQVEIRRAELDAPLVTQVAKPDFRPYLHPLKTPDGILPVTEFSPEHHRHQTGLYWGFTRLNGRDFFHHPEGTYWRRVSLTVTQAEAVDPADGVQWQTVYDLLAEDGSVLLRETQTWTLQDFGSSYALDLKWVGEAKTDLTIGRYDYGGLFLRMPWKPGMTGQAVNGARQEGQRAEGQRSVWMDVGLQLEGTDHLTHVAIFDHPSNKTFPQPWRVDGQLGVGPVRARLGDWHIGSGQTENIQHRLLVYTGELDDVALTERWSQYTGQQMAWAQWRLAQEEGRRAEFLTPEKAVQQMTLQDGFQVGVFASEPMITQPMAFCWDSRGRLWVAENRDYETRQSGFAADGKSRILILEDADRDGVAETKKVFAEGIPFPAGMAVGMGGLWLGAPPNLLFVPDRNSDDVADMDDIEVRLTGWGIRDRHETLNSFLWGPDGWLYGCQGYATPSMVGRPKDRGRLYQHNDPFPEVFEFAEPPVDINGGVWRYHPTKDRFEVVAHGFSNPWGLDYDAHGQLFITACVIPHLWHVIPGGIFHRQGGNHFNPHVYDDIKTIADHRHRSAHGGARIYQSDAFPEKYHGRIFMANIHEHAVLTDILEPKGSGFVGHHGDDFALANNAQWIGFSCEIGPDGNLFVLDWHDADICGKDVLNKETGRIFRFAPKESAAVDFPHRHADVASLTDVQLAELQNCPSNWHMRRSRLELHHRSIQRVIEPAAVALLRRQLVSGESSRQRLAAMWTLHMIGQLADDDLHALLTDRDEHLRAWSIQLICEDLGQETSLAASRYLSSARNASVSPRTSLPDGVGDLFVAMAQRDPSPVVRLYLASALQKLPDAVAWKVASNLSMRSEDNDDHNIPKMIWFGMERRVHDNLPASVELMRISNMPLLVRHSARRLVHGGLLHDVLAEILPGGALGTGTNQMPALLGIRDALEGRFDVPTPSHWPKVYAALRTQGGDAARIALQLSNQFGDAAAAEVMLTTLLDSGSDITDRRIALNGLAGRRRDELKKALPGLLSDDAIRRDAIRAVGAFDDEALATDLLHRYADLSPDDRLEVVHVLASRPGYGRQLTDSLKSGAVPKRDVPAYVAQLLRRVVGNSFVDVWGPLEESSADKEQLFGKYRELLTADAVSAADPSAGRAVFNRTCAACHRLHGSGGTIGPDITGANRGHLEYLLGNILTPSAIIQDAYRMQIILTNDGRVFSGIPVEENDRQLKLRIANRPDPVTIAKSSIESRDVAPVSMMPEGILKTFTDQEVLNLIAYLQTAQQVPLR